MGRAATSKLHLTMKHPSTTTGEASGYCHESLPGLNSAWEQPAATSPCNGTTDALRWWVRKGADGTLRTHSLMLGTTVKKTGKGASDYHQLLCEARYLNERGDGYGGEPDPLKHQAAAGPQPSLVP